MPCWPSLFSKGPTNASFLRHDFIHLPASWVCLNWEREPEKPGREKEVVSEESITGAWRGGCSPHKLCNTLVNTFMRVWRQAPAPPAPPARPWPSTPSHCDNSVYSASAHRAGWHIELPSRVHGHHVTFVCPISYVTSCAPPGPLMHIPQMAGPGMHRQILS